MKNKVVDQAEKLRQLAQKELQSQGGENAAATLEPTTIEKTVQKSPLLEPLAVDMNKTDADSAPSVTPTTSEKEAAKNTGDKKENTPASTPKKENGQPKQETKKSLPKPNAENKQNTEKPPTADEKTTTKSESQKTPSTKTENKDKTAGDEISENKTQPAESSKPEPETSSTPLKETKGESVKSPQPQEAPKPESSTASILKILHSKRFPVEKQTQVIAVTGGKGGVGKTNVTCNLALSMGQMGKRVMILDADLSLANVDVLLGLTPRYNLAHLLNGEKQLNEIIVQGPQNLQIIPSGSGLEELSQPTPDQMERLFEAFAKLSPMPDVLLIDTAAGIHSNVMQFLLAADQTIVVTTPEPTAYTDAYALIKTLVRHDPAREIGVIVNMANDRREAIEVTKLMLQMCRQFLKIVFNNLGYIPRDIEVLKAVRRQKPLLLSAPKAAASREIHNIASTVLQIEKKKTSSGLKGFFTRLFSLPSNRKAAS